MIAPNLLFFAWMGLASQASADQVVEDFIPYEILGVEPGDRESVSTCHAVASSDGAGQPIVIAAGYLGPARGRLLVLSRMPDASYAVVAESAANVSMSGSSCRLQMRDVDGSSPQEILMFVAQRRYEEAWIFRWDSGALSDLTPKMDAGTAEGSALWYPQFVDIKHDGTQQVFTVEEPPTDENVPGAAGVLYEFSAGEYVPQQDVRDVWFPVYRGTAIPTRRVRGGGEDGRFMLRLVNGRADTTGRVSVSSVRVNGAEVLPSTGFGVANEFLEIDLGLNLPYAAVVEITSTAHGSDGVLIAVLSQTAQ